MTEWRSLARRKKCRCADADAKYVNDLYECTYFWFLLCRVCNDLPFFLRQTCLKRIRLDMPLTHEDYMSKDGKREKICVKARMHVAFRVELKKKKLQGSK